MVQLEPLWILLGQDKHWIVCMWRNAGGYPLAHPGVEKKNPQGPQGSEVEDPGEIQESWSIMKRHEASWVSFPLHYGDQPSQGVQPAWSGQRSLVNHLGSIGFYHDSDPEFRQPLTTTTHLTREASTTFPG